MTQEELRPRIREILAILAGYCTTIECPSDALPEVNKRVDQILSLFPKPDWEMEGTIKKTSRKTSLTLEPYGDPTDIVDDEGKLYMFMLALMMFCDKKVRISITEIKEEK